MSHDLLVALFTAGLGAAGWHALALQRCTIAIVKLTLRLEDLTKRVEVIPKLEKDLNALHAKQREKSI